jgi:hypothetical protein
LVTVYNLSLPLALLLCVSAFLIYGKFKQWSCVIDLGDLATFSGSVHITHFASLVRPNHPSHQPNPELLRQLMAYAVNHEGPSKSAVRSGTTKQKSLANGPLRIETRTNVGADDKKPPKQLYEGLSLSDLAYLRVMREADLEPSMKMTSLSEQLALSEAALLWLAFREEGPASVSASRSDEKKLNAATSELLCDRDTAIIHTSALVQFLAEERLPKGWWEGLRPKRTIGLLEANRRASQVSAEMTKIRKQLGLS